MKRAEEIIQEALDTGRDTLNLKDLELTDLPPIFNELAPKLKKLNLRNNQLARIPRALGLCRQLETLDLSKNHLVTLAGISSLTSLTVLYLDANRISTFPTELLDLSRLRGLYLENNQLGNLPAGIQRLSNLKALHLQGNQLESLPPVIAEMTHLQELPLDGNPLRTPPYEVAMSGLDAIRSYFDDLTKTGIGEQKAESKKHLLAVALDEYGRAYDPRPGGVAECRELVEVLQSNYQFTEVQTLYNEEATLDRLRAALSDLVNTAGPEDVVLFYFSGWTRDVTSETGYITYEPADFEGEELLSMLRSMRAEHIVLIIDNHFYSSLLGGTRGTTIISTQYNSRWVLYRRGAEWEERFTPRLTRLLRENSLEIGIQELADLLEVEAGPLMVGSEGGGEFYFLPDEEAVNANTASGIVDPRLKETREMVARGELQEAIDLFVKIGDLPLSYQDRVLLLRSRYSKLEQAFQRSTMTEDSYRAERNKLASALLDLTKLVQEEVVWQKRDEPLERIIQNIQHVERLRKEYQTLERTDRRRELSQQIDRLLLENEKLRLDLEVGSSSLGPTGVGKEIAYWYVVSQRDTIPDYESYLQDFPNSTYSADARRRIAELELLAREEETVANIKANRHYGDIQQYLSAFPDGKHREEVEQILWELEIEEVDLWETTKKENTIAAYRAYSERSKIGKYSAKALEKISQLEQEGSATHLNEAKLIFVGNGRVGKTSLSRVLANDGFNPDEPSTHGIRIVPWELDLTDGRRLKINMWDFGGQEIYHNTHRFFLTTRALYLLVWDKDSLPAVAGAQVADDQFAPQYWLDNVDALSGGSPVVMVQNKVEEGVHYLDGLNELTQRYNIREVSTVSAKEGTDVGRLRALIEKQYRQAKGLSELIGYEMPANWIAVRAELQTLADQQHHYLPYEDYLRLCEKHELAKGSARELAVFLTEIGQLLYFPAHRSLRDVVFLDPIWVTELIYRAMNKQVAAGQGVFTEKDLRNAWQEPKAGELPDTFRFRNEKEVEIFLELMRHFEVCFAMEGKEEVFIAPQYLPLDPPPAVAQWDARGAYVFGYQYECLHKSVIARAIVRFGPLAAPGEYWREGILFEKAGNQVLIRADLANQRIRIAVKGADPEAVRKLVVEEAFADIHGEQQVEPILYCHHCEGVILRRQAEQLLEQGSKEVYCEAGGHNVDIQSLLQPQGMSQTPNFFISYATEDAAYKNDLVKKLQALNWLDKIEIWEHEQIDLGENLDEATRRAFASADIIVLLVTFNFLSSRYIREVEFEQAMERHQRGEVLIVPILMEDSTWDLTPIGKLQVAPIDKIPFENRPDKNAAWKDIIVRIHAQLQKHFDWGG